MTLLMPLCIMNVEVALREAATFAISRIISNGVGGGDSGEHDFLFELHIVEYEIISLGEILDGVANWKRDLIGESLVVVKSNAKASEAFTG